MNQRGANPFAAATLASAQSAVQNAAAKRNPLMVVRAPRKATNNAKQTYATNVAPCATVKNVLVIGFEKIAYPIGVGEEVLGSADRIRLRPKCQSLALPLNS